MAHNLMFENDKAAMMYTGELPWHGLGTRLDKPATAEEAMAAAQLGWEVRKEPLYFQQDGQNWKIPDRYAIVRPSSEKPIALGFVGSHYTPLQNKEAFAFFDPIAGKDAAIYHTAGALGRGEKVWILAKLPDSIRVIGDDITEKYLLLSNSHDGQSPVQLRFTPVRVVCQNTLTLATKGLDSWRVVHHPSIHERLQDAEKMLGIIHTEFDEVEAVFKEMDRVQMNEDRLEQYLQQVFPTPKDADDAFITRVKRDRNSSKRLFEEGQGNRMKGVAGTLWAAYNGVTDWVDHRTTRQDRNQRLNSLWFGEGFRTKARAYSVAKDMAVLVS